MEANTGRFSPRVGLLLAALVAFCLVAIPASAKPQFKGTFTLTHEVRWGKATLSAGEYSLQLDQTAHTMLISDARTNKPVALELDRIDNNAQNRDSTLVVAVEGNQRIICSVRLAGLGEVFHSAPDFARATTEEAITIHGSGSTGK